MSRSPLVIDVPPRLQAVVDEAAVAYAMTSDYAVLMCARARVILAKQAQWNSRKQLRAAEDVARAACEAAAPFTCESELPCGVGPRCRQAAGDLATFEPVLVPLGRTRGGKDVQRPQPGPDGTHGSYNLESVVGAWRDHLEASSGAA